MVPCRGEKESSGTKLCICLGRAFGPGQLSGGSGTLVTVILFRGQVGIDISPWADYQED